ncbi:glycosyltransferase [Quadrisphaera sp. KR29]|uniref:glycosyltransferase n=1 Tax=Quadrisphaera sp. KR29 TaxID=3461391 RepID=UPI0040445A3A
MNTQEAPTMPHRTPTAPRPLLYLAKELPVPANSGGRIRTLELARAFERAARAHAEAAGGPGSEPEVRVLGFSDEPLDGRVRELPGTVLGVQRRSPLPGALKAGSLAVGRWSHPRLEAELRRWRGRSVHLHVDSPQVLVNVPRGMPVTSIDFQNVESDLLRQRLSSGGSLLRRLAAPVESARTAAWERRAARVPLVTCCTPQDVERLAQLGVPGAVVVPNGTQVPAAVAPVPADPTAVFVGALDWEPNVEAVSYLLERVWPLVRARVPRARLAVVGRSPAPRLRAAHGRDGVEVHADVPSVAPHYAAAATAVSPLLTGGGSRLKIVEALAHARPVVSTALGAEGLEDLVGRGVVLAETPEALADAVATRLAGPGAAQAEGLVAREAVRATWSWEAVTAPLADALADGL